MSRVSADMGGPIADELANQAADQALVALLDKLHKLEGRSRFTTWAYKFAVLHAANAVRTAAWRDREIDLEGLDLVADPSPGPGHYAEAAALADRPGRSTRHARSSRGCPACAEEAATLAVLVAEDAGLDAAGVLTQLV